jgi:hypothetical protein
MSALLQSDGTNAFVVDTEERISIFNQKWPCFPSEQEGDASYVTCKFILFIKPSLRQTYVSKVHMALYPLYVSSDIIQIPADIQVYNARFLIETHNSKYNDN